MIRGCAIILGTFLGAAPRFLGIIFLVKLDFFKYSGLLSRFCGIDFDISINDIVERCLKGSCFLFPL